MKRLIWKIKYAMYLRKRLQVTWNMSWESAGAALENLDNDFAEHDAIDAARDEISYWVADAR